MKKLFVILFSFMLLSTMAFAQETKQRVQSEEEKTLAADAQKGDLTRDQLRERDYTENEAVKDQAQDQIRLRTRDRIKECTELKKELKKMTQVRQKSGELKQVKSGNGSGKGRK